MAVIVQCSTTLSEIENKEAGKIHWDYTNHCMCRDNMKNGRKLIISGKYKKWQGYFVSVMKRYFSTTIRQTTGRVPLAGKYG